MTDAHGGTLCKHAHWRQCQSTPQIRARAISRVRTSFISPSTELQRANWGVGGQNWPADDKVITPELWQIIRDAGDVRLKQLWDKSFNMKALGGGAGQGRADSLHCRERAMMAEYLCTGRHRPVKPHTSTQWIAPLKLAQDCICDYIGCYQDVPASVSRHFSPRLLTLIPLFHWTKKTPTNIWHLSVCQGAEQSAFVPRLNDSAIGWD